MYSRSWFAWANTVFGDFIIHLDKEHPHLLQGPPAPTDPTGSGSVSVRFEFVVVALSSVLIQFFKIIKIDV